MKVTIMGTGTSQGIPVIGCLCETCTSSDPMDKRLRSSIHIHVEGQNLLIDIGPDFRAQMLNNDLKKVDAVLLTHEHNDHVAGVDDIRPINFSYQPLMPFYGEKRVLTQIEERFHYAFSEQKYPGAPSLKLIPISDQSFQIETVKVIPIRVMHGQLPILGYKIGKMAYLTDVKSIPESEFEKLTNLDVLIISALRKEPHFSHLNLEEALRLTETIDARQTFFTHISHLMGPARKVQSLLPSKVKLAYDGQVINL